MSFDNQKINLIIAGGESGHNARPMHPEWVRMLRDQCNLFKINFYFKQWGHYLPFEMTAQPPFFKNCATKEEFDGHLMNFIDVQTGDSGKFLGHKWMNFDDNMIFNQENLLPDCHFLAMGKHKTGSMLDEKFYIQIPK